MASSTASTSATASVLSPTLAFTSSTQSVPLLMANATVYAVKEGDETFVPISGMEEASFKIFNSQVLLPFSLQDGTTHTFLGPFIGQNKKKFGNELCAAGIGARVDSVQYAKDITRLRRIVNLLYPDVSRRPKVLGPGGFYGKEWFESFLLNVGPGVVDGVTHHIYNLGAGVDKDIINKLQDPYYLSQVAETFKSVAQAVKEFTPWAAPWVGEAGGAYNSGSKDVSHTFVNGFWLV
ncbi:heparanase-like protein 1 [Cajanus cajan]|uniref:heparanase-like protein 1 n=1 Tax=Cajanus cajan TaxID=3821 RepID=UPI00098DD54C|nr:heparanase-like protein 1 [Cajanus cajan]